MQNQQDFDSLVGKPAFDENNPRRNFLQTAVGVGFAAAALPVCAQTIVSTDTKGLSTGVAMIEVNGQKVPVYHAQPEGKTNLPVVLVITEIFGVHEHIADIARRFAKEGYLALAADFFVRQGDASKYPNIAELIKEVISKVPDAQVMKDLDAVVAWAKANGGDTKRLAITGFCWGGRITWMYSAHNPNVKAGVAWYGGLRGETNELRPSQPVNIGATLKTPVLGLYGAKDNGIPLDSIEQMKVELAKGSSHSEFMVYPNSGHGFHADYRPSYNATDAKDGWQRCLAWFKANLG